MHTLRRLDVTAVVLGQPSGRDARDDPSFSNPLSHQDICACFTAFHVAGEEFETCKARVRVAIDVVLRGVNHFPRAVGEGTKGNAESPRFPAAVIYLLVSERSQLVVWLA